MVTIQDQIRCARRELAMRKAVYPRRVTAGKMEQAEADREAEAMAAIVATLECLRDILANINGGDRPW